LPVSISATTTRTSRQIRIFSHSYCASWYYQSLLFTNECTIDCRKKNTILKFTLKQLRHVSV